MKKLAKLGLVAITLVTMGCNFGNRNEGPLQVAFVSHTYHLHKHKDIQDMLVQSINQEKPKYIFSLGDVVLVNDDFRWKKAEEFFGKLDGPVYFSPGNHDLHSFYEVESQETDRHYPERRQQYIDRIGYVNKMVQDDNADFIMINSNDPFIKTQPFLDESIAKANPNTPNFLLTHHPIWIDRYRKNWIQWYWRSIKRDEIAPYLADFQRIIVGDISGSIQHHKFNETPATMIGIGNDGDPVFWVLATLQDNGEFSFEAKTIELPEHHPYKKKQR
ncbi:metallophosphoesterase family protein [Teredinibacter haidensis]|uniref:metallophosphoesterase family protein n=1 Tax=Teredinibacter haidensis TaxID=2731755 RepID=UPI000948C5A3|nr:metallophosphoesterase [Teredinibacter haidensis]